MFDTSFSFSLCCLSRTQLHPSQCYMTIGSDCVLLLCQLGISSGPCEVTSPESLVHQII